MSAVISEPFVYLQRFSPTGEQSLHLEWTHPGTWQPVAVYCQGMGAGSGSQQHLRLALDVGPASFLSESVYWVDGSPGAWACSWLLQGQEANTPQMYLAGKLPVLYLQRGWILTALLGDWPGKGDLRVFRVLARRVD